jgi:hypothetical protein
LPSAPTGEEGWIRRAASQRGTRTPEEEVVLSFEIRRRSANVACTGGRKAADQVSANFKTEDAYLTPYPVGWWLRGFREPS